MVSLAGIEKNNASQSWFEEKKRLSNKVRELIDHFNRYFEIEELAQEHYSEIIFRQKDSVSLDGSFDLQSARPLLDSYLNCLGYINSFFNAQWLHTLICCCGAKKKCSEYEKFLTSSTPTIKRLMPIRNKYTAHHQKDSPRNDDFEGYGLNQSGIYLVFAGNIGEPGKIQAIFPLKRKNEKNNDEWLSLVLSDSHPKILNEIEMLKNYLDGKLL